MYCYLLKAHLLNSVLNKQDSKIGIVFDFHWNALNLKRLDTLRKKIERFACQNFPFFFLKINYVLNLDDRQRGDDFWQLSNVIFKKMGNNISDSLHICVISRSLILWFFSSKNWQLLQSSTCHIHCLHCPWSSVPFNAASSPNKTISLFHVRKTPSI